MGLLAWPGPSERRVQQRVSEHPTPMRRSRAFDRERFDLIRDMYMLVIKQSGYNKLDLKIENKDK